jgi:predicted 3'-5' exonuclease similar to PolB exonuclease domain
LQYHSLRQPASVTRSLGESGCVRGAQWDLRVNRREWMAAKLKKYYRDGRIKEIAEYCESDVINTYRVWLRYELFRGKLTTQSYETSEANLQKFLESRNTITRCCKDGAEKISQRVDYSKHAGPYEVENFA